MKKFEVSTRNSKNTKIFKIEEYGKEFNIYELKEGLIWDDWIKINDKTLKTFEAAKGFIQNFIGNEFLRM